MKLGQLQGVVGMAVVDALGPYADQPELRSRWERSQDEGKRLQVAGHIDVAKLEHQVATAVVAFVKREHPEVMEEEAWDDV